MGACRERGSHTDSPTCRVLLGSVDTSLGNRSVQFRPSEKTFWKSRKGLGTRFGLWRANGEAREVPGGG